MPTPDEFMTDVMRLGTLIFKDLWRSEPATADELDKFSDGVLQLAEKQKEESDDGYQGS